MFANSQSFGGSTCLACFLILGVVGWLASKRKEQAAAQRYSYQHAAPTRPSLLRQLTLGVGTSLIGGVIRAMFGGHHHHRHHHG